MSKQFYTRKEIATLFKVSIYTIDNWIKNGSLSCIKFAGAVRITEENIEDFLSTKKKEND